MGAVSQRGCHGIAIKPEAQISYQPSSSSPHFACSVESWRKRAQDPGDGVQPLCHVQSVVAAGYYGSTLGLWSGILKMSLRAAVIPAVMAALQGFDAE